MALRDVLAAGAVVYRPGRQVLLVHRPKYDDWSFPKGKLDPGEHQTAAAVREVAEETGLRVRLGPPLSSQRYLAGGRMKTVSYWVGRAVDADDVSGYEPNEEIDGVEWAPYDEAMARLTYPHDRDTLRESKKLRRRTAALVVLRHGAARSRKVWQGDDRVRPLLQPGLLQAEHLVAVLAAYDVTRVVSSSSLRCVQTVRPYADATASCLEEQDGLSEEDATRASVGTIVDELLRGDRGAVLCTHRPVLPDVFDALGVADPGLEPGGMLVAHVRRGRIVSTEQHLVR
jgi:8-oxo-dGTP pyrophosphatase MutT (NUDIX family)/phosphohistidine phosphatase SixA